MIEEEMIAPSTDEENGKCRLMISMMELENFKSYAGTKVIGPFHKCFSSVVGPNGSGKSNVIDAMLFVFGKRAKKLRLNKVSELIHNSSAFKNNPLQYARVSVYFHEIIDTGDGGEDFSIVPNSEMVISRIARRDNSSTYKLNKKNCSFNEVKKYLDSKGIDLNNNRFLILQGEVEMISMMPPKGKMENDDGLLEYLEDIIGSYKFIEKTNEVMSKIEVLTEQRQERLNRLKAIEKEKDSLEGAKLEAEALIGKDREIRKKKNILYQVKAFLASEEAKSLNEDKESLLEKKKELKLQFQETKDRIEGMEKTLKAQSLGYDKLFLELKKTEEAFLSYERREIELKENEKHLKNKKKKLASKLTKNTNQEKESLSKHEEAKDKIPSFEKLQQEVSQQKIKEDAKLEHLFDEMKEKTQELRGLLEAKTLELAPILQERAVYQADLDTATMEVKLLEDSTRRAQQQLSSAKKELSSLDKNQSTAKDTLKKNEKEFLQAKDRLQDAKEEEKSLQEDEKKLAAKSSEFIARAEEAKASQTSKNRSKAVEGILKASKQGGELSKIGVIGRLGDLATISEKYDVAISTACHMLDHVVVKTTMAAQKCLEFLRKHNLGRANFIPLDKMKKGMHDRAVETPEQAPRLFELIRPVHPLVIPAFYLALSNTLVAKDLETATRLAYEYNKRWRVVTLDGQLIEMSGTMSGGGKSAHKGGMRLSSKNSKHRNINLENNEESCEELFRQARNAAEELKNCRSKLRSITEEIRTLEKRIPILCKSISKLKVEISGFDTTRVELTKQLPGLERQSTLSAEDKKKLQDLNSKVHEKKSVMSTCSKQAKKLESEKNKLQQDIKNAGGPKLSKQQSLCEEISKKINQTNKDLSSSKVTIESSLKAAAKARKEHQKIEKDITLCEESLDKTKIELNTLSSEAKAIQESFDKAKQSEKRKLGEIKSIEKELNDIKKIEAEQKCVEVEINEQKDTYLRQVKECNKRIKHWNEELKKLNVEEEKDEDYISDDEEEKEEDTISKSVDTKVNEEMEIDDDKEDVKEDDKENVKMEITSTIKERRTRNTKLSSLPIFNEEALLQYQNINISEDIETLQEERNELAKNTNMAAIAEYRKRETIYLTRASELEAVSTLRNEARKEHEDLRRQRLEMFMDGFGIITLKLKEMYQMITLGGDAELELVDSLDPFSEGIVFSVRPPKKSWKNIANLSGGEKTLSSLALVFALHHYNPTPLYVLDEIDAALDFKNVSIVGNYIKERTKNAQFIIISLRNNMFELADRLVGIYKTNNCTKSVTVDPKAFQKSILADRTNSMVDSS